VEKMSKSRGNYVGILEPPAEMFGKVMSIPDEALEQWWTMLVGGGEHPEAAMEWKLELARRITARWHGEEGARAGEEHFTRVVRRHEAPEEVPEATFEAAEGVVYLPGLLAALAGNSASHWRRQIDQGGVKLDGSSVADYEVAAATLDGALLQAGKRRYFRLRPA
jgi:tyrosyl-tRNA synthetase